MLKQHEPNPEQEQPAAQVRVKSEELIAALAAIEARQAQRDSELVGTLTPYPPSQMGTTFTTLMLWMRTRLSGPPCLSFGKRSSPTYTK